jgi:putative transposase
VPRILISIKQQLFFHFHALQEHVLRWIKPPTTSLVLGILADLTRGKAELLAENALLRQQLIILRRQVTRPVYSEGRSFSPGAPGQNGSDLETGPLHYPAGDTSRLPPWTLPCVLETQIEGVREKAEALARDDCLDQGDGGKQSASCERSVSAGNSSNWIFGEVKRTIQKYMKQIRPKRARGQNWKTFFHNHAQEMWACDFLQATSLFFRSLFASFVIEVKSRKVIQVNVTRSPTDPWVAQQLREATPYGHTPKYLIRDNDRKFGPNFARVAIASGIKVLRTPTKRRKPMPSANAFSWAW